MGHPLFFVLLHKLLHTLRFRFASYIATSVAASHCTIKWYIHCYHFYEAKRKRTGCIIVWSRTRTQRMANFMKHKENAKDGQFYEAKRKRKGWTILWSKLCVCFSLGIQSSLCLVLLTVFVLRERSRYITLTARATPLRFVKYNCSSFVFRCAS